MFACVNGPYQVAGFVWGTHEAGLLVSILLGFVVVLKVLFAHMLITEWTVPMLPVWLAVIDPLSTMEYGPPKFEPKLYV
jgi:hypothetical protein